MNIYIQHHFNVAVCGNRYDCLSPSQFLTTDREMWENHHCGILGCILQPMWILCKFPYDCISVWITACFNLSFLIWSFMLTKRELFSTILLLWLICNVYGIPSLHPFHKFYKFFLLVYSPTWQWQTIRLVMTDETGWHWYSHCLLWLCPTSL